MGLGAGKSSKMIKKFDKKDEESGTRWDSDAHPPPRGSLPPIARRHLLSGPADRGAWAPVCLGAGSSWGPAPSPSPGRRSLPSGRALQSRRPRAASGCSAAPPPPLPLPLRLPHFWRSPSKPPPLGVGCFAEAAGPWLLAARMGVRV